MKQNHSQHDILFHPENNLRGSQAGECGRGQVNSPQGSQPKLSRLSRLGFPPFPGECLATALSFAFRTGLQKHVSFMSELTTVFESRQYRLLLLTSLVMSKVHGYHGQYYYANCFNHFQGKCHLKRVPQLELCKMCPVPQDILTFSRDFRKQFVPAMSETYSGNPVSQIIFIGYGATG